MRLFVAFFSLGCGYLVVMTIYSLQFIFHFFFWFEANFTIAFVENPGHNTDNVERGYRVFTTKCYRI